MKTADLAKYRVLAERLECIEEQLERKEVHDVVIGNSGAPAYSKVTKSIEGYPLDNKTQALLLEKAKSLKEMQAIEDYIYAIPSRRERNALKIYCLECKEEKTRDGEYIKKVYYTWQEVAEKMGERDCRALVKAVERCLAKIEQNAQKEG